jgi:hypothetical protein
LRSLTIDNVALTLVGFAMYAGDSMVLSVMAVSKYLESSLWRSRASSTIPSDVTGSSVARVAGWITGVLSVFTASSVYRIGVLTLRLK